jgi:hypothetical protein
MKKLEFIICLMTFSLMFTVATGQKRKPTNPKPKATANSSLKPEPASLSIEAGLVYTNGDVKPVARTTLYLLDEDLMTVLKPFEWIPGKPLTPGLLNSQLDLYFSVFNSPSVDEVHRSKAKAKFHQIKEAISAHTVATVTTDFSGKAKFESLTPGTGFVYGEFQVGRERVAWNEKVELKAGTETRLVLDNNNRSY